MLSTIEIFCCYARKDQLFLEKIKASLAPLQRQGLITIWDDTDINAGKEWENALNNYLNRAQIILLLVSPDFVASDYCYSKGMQQAMKRHELGEASVIPVILRPIHWQGTPFGKLQVLPKNEKPITSSSWHNQDEAIFDVAEDLRKIINTSIDTTVNQEVPYTEYQLDLNSNKPSQVRQTDQQHMIPSSLIRLPAAKPLPKKDIVVLCCYTHRDKPYRHYLMVHMHPIQRICTWHDMDINLGNREELNKYLRVAQIIIPMLSTNFLWEDSAYSEEMLNAIKRHERREVCVLPINLRPTSYKGSPFENLPMLPSNKKALTTWEDQNEGLVSIVVGIRNAIIQFTTS